MDDFEHWRQASLKQLGRTDLQVSLLMLAITFAAAIFLSRWWALGVIVFFGFFYVRMHQVIMRKEELLESTSRQPAGRWGSTRDELPTPKS